VSSSYAVVVVGGGHAGCEAALAAARMGMRTALVTLSIDKIALMPCNPAIGGVGKGQLTREIDALGGEQGRNADRAFIQIRMLNTSKGPAVRALRAQADKRLYEDWMKWILFRTPLLDVFQGEVARVLVSRETVSGVKLADGRELRAPAVVVATGTFLRGEVVVGDRTHPAGRAGELPATELSAGLEEIGLSLERFQTATPPRVDGRTIDISKMSWQPGDPSLPGFSHWSTPLPRRQVPCFLTRTSPTTHAVVAEHLHLSPIRTGAVQGKGPRYCPSIDRKVINFPTRDHHPVFVEPEGLSTNEVYLQGLTTSLPVWVQERIVQATPGLERARVVRPGYAVMYDYLPPQQLLLSLETKAIHGLFTAGQINGTSGYEEAAAQGLMAGINAALYVKGESPFILRRDQAYIGVLLDDLVTKGVDEPYRMFTSRAEFRLLLRHDNADLRLSALGCALGLVSKSDMEQVKRKREQVDRYGEMLGRIVVKSSEANSRVLEAHGTSPLTESQTVMQLLRRPQLSLDSITPLLDERDRHIMAEVSKAAAEQLEVKARYDGYIQRQLAEVRRHSSREALRIPADFDFDLEGMTYEARQKLKGIRPGTLGQASRIPGVSPADVSVLMLYLHRRRMQKDGEPTVSAEMSV